MAVPSTRRGSRSCCGSVRGPAGRGATASGAALRSPHAGPRRKGLQIHLILDNYSTHKHENVKHWLAKQPRFQLHFIPTSSSWLNIVERLFGRLEDKAIRRAIFKSVPDLIAAIEAYLQANNEDPKPFVWTATAESILTNVRRGRVTLDATTT